MKQPADRTNPMVTFVVRFWREASAGDGRWRGQIEHVRSGERAAFLDAEGMFRFMRQFGIAVGDEPGANHQRPSSEGSQSLPAKRDDSAIR